MIKTAIILAGGLGERLLPLTQNTPKPLLPLKGKPILGHIISQLQKHGITSIILSVGYKAELIRQYFKEKPVPGVDISYVIETEPLGTGGAVKKAAAEFTTPFFLLWGDNLMDINFKEMEAMHVQDTSKIVMALTQREDVEHFGVVTLKKKHIIGFVEKPARDKAPSNLVNAGAFIIPPGILKILPEGKCSMEKDCFEKLAPEEKIIPYICQGQWFPTDTLEKYAIACQEFVPTVNLAEKKVIIADVDDTICYSREQISTSMAQQINALIKKGYQFAFISGTKAEDLLSMISSGVLESHHLLATTGTKYVKVKSPEERIFVYNHSLTMEEVKEISAAFEKLITKFNLKSLTTKEDQLQERGSQITLSALGRHAPTELKREFDPDGERRKQMVMFLRQHLDEKKYEIGIAGLTSIDVTKKGFDKEWGIREFLKFNNLKAENVLFFGDKLYPGGNDYPATRIVDCVSVKNPEETLMELKKLP